MPMQEILYGTTLTENEIPTISGPLRLGGSDFHAVRRFGRADHGKQAFFLNDDILSRGLLCMGATGCGKTNTINTIMKQQISDMGDDDVMIVFDTKGDFYDEFYRPGIDLCIGNSGKFNGVSQRWNLYNELLVNGWQEEKNLVTGIREMSTALFSRYASAQQPFFVNAARDIFSDYLTINLREARDDPEFFREYLNNYGIRDYFMSHEMEDFMHLGDYNGLSAANLYLGTEANEQGQGVMSEVMVMVSDNFQGVFAEKGDFSIQKFVRNRGGRCLFVEYDLAIGETLSPIYSLLIDLALKEAMGRQNDRKGRTYIVIDEFKLLPYLMHMDDAVNFGRGMGLRVIAGLQSISQLYEMYGQYKGISIAAGFNTLLAFRPNDTMTRDFIREYFGRNLIQTTFTQDNKPVSRTRNGYTVEDWEINKLKKGDAVVGILDNPPFFFHFDRFE